MNGKPVYEVESSVLNLDSGFKTKLLCDGPTFSAGTACAYSCAYCYVPAIMAKSKHLIKDGQRLEHERVVVRRLSPATKMREALRGRNGLKFSDQKDNRVIYGSPLVDVAANMELVRETVEIVQEILDATHWQVRLLSKSNLLTEVAKMLGGFRDAPRRVIYGVSTGTFDDRIGKVIERGTPLVSKRIESLHWLQDNGFRTFAMVCPSLPNEKDMAFAFEARDRLRYERCEHVWAEVMNARGRAFDLTISALDSAGFGKEADRLRQVKEEDGAWESYARMAFLGHRQATKDLVGADGTTFLRFLQYVNNSSLSFWDAYTTRGAVIL